MLQGKWWHVISQYLLSLYVHIHPKTVAQGKDGRKTKLSQTTISFSPGRRGKKSAVVRKRELKELEPLLNRHVYLHYWCLRRYTHKEPTCQYHFTMVFFSRHLLMNIELSK